MKIFGITPIVGYGGEVCTYPIYGLPTNMFKTKEEAETFLDETHPSWRKDSWGDITICEYEITPLFQPLYKGKMWD